MPNDLRLSPRLSLTRRVLICHTGGISRGWSRSVAGQAADFAGRAGEAALAALAFEDAVHWYERAAACLATLRAGDDEQARAALRLGAARLAAGDLDGGGAAFRQAAERARRARRPDLLARAALGLGGGPAGFEVGLLDGEQISLLEEERFALPDGQGGRCLTWTPARWTCSPRPARPSTPRPLP